MVESKIKLLLDRANFYAVLTRAFLEPPDVRLYNFLQAIQRKIKDTETDLLEENWNKEKDAIIQDWHDLFKVPMNKYVTPYESVYLGKRIDGQEAAPLLMGESAARLTRLYRIAGFKIPGNNMPDHIGVELGFLSATFRREAEEVKRSAQSDHEACRILREQFLKQHLLRWIQPFCDNLSSKAQTPFYKFLSHLIRDAVHSEIHEKEPSTK